jgi:hypothetical protein
MFLHLPSYYSAALHNRERDTKRVGATALFSCSLEVLVERGEEDAVLIIDSALG